MLTIALGKKFNFSFHFYIADNKDLVLLIFK